MLLRVVCREGRLLPDPSHSASGRGAWVHLTCAEQALERGGFTRALRLNASPESEELLHYINEMDAKDMKLK